MNLKEEDSMLMTQLNISEEGKRIGLDIFQVMVTNYVHKRGLGNAYKCIC